MGDLASGHRDRADELRTVLRDRLGEFDAEVAEPGTAKYAACAEAVLRATRALVRAEKDAVAESLRRGARQVQVVAGLTALISTGLILVSVVGWVSRIWLLLTVPVALVAYGGWLMEIGAFGQRLGQRRVGSGVLAVAALGAGVEMAMPVPTWVLMVTVALAIVGGVVWFDGLGVPIRDQLFREHDYR